MVVVVHVGLSAASDSAMVRKARRTNEIQELRGQFRTEAGRVSGISGGLVILALEIKFENRHKFKKWKLNF